MVIKIKIGEAHDAIARVYHLFIASVLHTAAVSRSRLKRGEVRVGGGFWWCAMVIIKKATDAQQHRQFSVYLPAQLSVAYSKPLTRPFKSDYCVHGYHRQRTAESNDNFDGNKYRLLNLYFKRHARLQC